MSNFTNQSPAQHQSAASQASDLAGRLFHLLGEYEHSAVAAAVSREQGEAEDVQDELVERVNAARDAVFALLEGAAEGRNRGAVRCLVRRIGALVDAAVAQALAQLGDDAEDLALTGSRVDSARDAVCSRVAELSDPPAASDRSLADTVRDLAVRAERELLAGVDEPSALLRGLTRDLVEVTAGVATSHTDLRRAAEHAVRTYEVLLCADPSVAFQTAVESAVVRLSSSALIAAAVKALVDRVDLHEDEAPVDDPADDVAGGACDACGGPDATCVCGDLAPVGTLTGDADDEPLAERLEGLIHELSVASLTRGAASALVGDSADVESVRAAAYARWVVALDGAVRAAREVATSTGRRDTGGQAGGAS